MTKINKFINTNNKNNCLDINGKFEKLSKKEQKILFKSNNKYIKKYIKNFNLLEKNYKNTIIKLYDILITLNNTKILDNNSLNKIIKNSYTLISKLHTNCKLYYSACIIAYLQYKFNN